MPDNLEHRLENLGTALRAEPVPMGSWFTPTVRKQRMRTRVQWTIGVVSGVAALAAGWALVSTLGAPKAPPSFPPPVIATDTTAPNLERTVGFLNRRAMETGELPVDLPGPATTRPAGLTSAAVRIGASRSEQVVKELLGGR